MRQTIKTGPKRRRQTRRELPYGQRRLWDVYGYTKRVKYPIIDADDLHFLDADDNPSSYWYDERSNEVYDDYLDAISYDYVDDDDWFDREYEDFHSPDSRWDDDFDEVDYLDLYR